MSAELHETAGEFEDYITCPHCGEVDHETYDYPEKLRRDGDTAVPTCESCDREFRVTLCVEYTYRADPLPEKSHVR